MCQLEAAAKMARPFGLGNATAFLIYRADGTPIMMVEDLETAMAMVAGQRLFIVAAWRETFVSVAGSAAVSVRNDPGALPITIAASWAECWRGLAAGAAVGRRGRCGAACGRAKAGWSQHSTYPVLIPDNVREQALRVRERARHLTGDLAADRLLHFARELDAPDAMDEPTVRLLPTAAALAAGGQADGTLIDSRHGLLRVARPNDELNWDQAAALISPNISDRSCNRAR